MFSIDMSSVGASLRFEPTTAVAATTPLPPMSQNCCGPGCRKPATHTEHFYDDRYFNWQNKLAQEIHEHAEEASNHTGTRNWAINTLGLKYPLQSHTVVADFGCAGAWTLNTIEASEKVCVEFNDVARHWTQTHRPNIRAYKYVEMLEDNSIDVFYSKSVLEHVECPIQELRGIYEKVKPGGRVAVGIKNEGMELSRWFSVKDVHNHLYTWNNANLGNMVQAAGFLVKSVEPGSILGRAGWKLHTSRIIEQDFGWKSHTFVYLWCIAFKPMNL